MDHDPLPCLAQAVCALLAQGLTQEPAVLDYMRSCFGIEQAQGLDRLLADRDSGEAACLVALLLSPGQDFFLRLEPELGQMALSPDQIRDLGAQLARQIQSVAVILPGPVRLNKAVSQAELELFLARLNLDRAMPEPLAQILSRRFPLDLGLAARVRLRHARLAWSEARLGFLGQLFENLDPLNPQALDLLDWSLAWLGGQGPNFEPRAALGQKHQELTSLLAQAQELYAYLEKGNYETLMMQGLRVALPRPEAVARELARLDQVSKLVLGWPASRLSGIIVENLGDHQNPEGLIAALGLWSMGDF